MKKNKLVVFLIYLLSISFLSACATSKCECENNNYYKKRKSKVSLINSQTFSTFVLQKDISIS